MAYIEREALLRYLNDIWLMATPTDAMPDDDRQLAIVRCMGLNDAMEAVKDATAADVVPVVRCKDCEYWDATQEAPLSEGCFLCTLEGGYPKGDFYCALGERRMDGTEPPKEET